MKTNIKVFSLVVVLISPLPSFCNKNPLFDATSQPTASIQEIGCPEGLGPDVVHIPSLPYYSAGRSTCDAENNLNNANTIDCGGNSFNQPEEVFIFSPETTGIYHILITSATSYTSLTLTEGCPLAGQGGVCIANVTGSSGNKVIEALLESGKTYYLIVSRSFGGCFSYDISIGLPAECPEGLGPDVVHVPSLPYHSTGRSTCDAENNLNNANIIDCGGTSFNEREEVFVFTAEVSGMHHMIITTSTSYTSMTLTEGCPLLGQGGVCIESVTGSEASKSIAAELESGKTYYLIVSRSFGGCFTYDISIGLPAECPEGLGPNVVHVPSLPYHSEGRSTCDAENNLNNANTIDCGGNSFNEREEVFVFTAEVSSMHHIILTTSASYSSMTLTEGCPLLGQEGLCIENVTGSVGNKSIEALLEAGKTYYLIISRSLGGCIDYDISISVPLTCPEGLGPNVVFVPSLPYYSEGRSTCDAENNLNNANTIDCGGTSFNEREEVFTFSPEVSDIYHLQVTSTVSYSSITLTEGCPLLDQEGVCVESISGPGLFKQIEAFLESDKTYYLIVSRSLGGCIDYEISIDFPVIYPLAVSASATPSAICLGETIQLYAGASGGQGDYAYQWTSDPPGFNSDIHNPIVSPEVNTTYHVQLSVDNEIVTASVSVEVYLDEPPSEIINMFPADNVFDLQQPFEFLWDATSNTAYYDLYIWRTNQQKPTVPTVSGIDSNTYASEYLNTNYIYNWQVVAVNPCFVTESEIFTFAFRLFPDLVVSEVVAPETALSGTDISISYTVTNIGEGETGWMPWIDRVYLSETPEFDQANALIVGTFPNASFLGSGESYVIDTAITLDNYLEGQFYVVVIADAANNVQETDEDNNLLASDMPVEVIMSPFSDLLVKDVQPISESVMPGSVFTVGWTVENIGNAAAVGGWSQRISLVNDNGRRVLGFEQHSEPLQSSAILSKTASFIIPEAFGLEGDFYIEVQLIPNPNLVEVPGGDANNIAISEGSVPIEKHLFLTLSAQSIQENATEPIQGMVIRSGSRGQELDVALDLSEEGRLILPGMATIPAGQSGVSFAVYAIDNDVFEGNIEVIIAADADDYAGSDALLTIIDDEVNILFVDISESEAFKGDVVPVSIAREYVTNTPLLVSLFANHPSACELQANVTIEAGETTTTFNMMLTNNGIPELPKELVITAYAPGLVTGTDTIIVNDSNIPQITFEIFPDTVSEGDGAFAAWGSLSRIEAGNHPIIIKIAAQPQGQVFFPSQITIPANAMEKQFNIGVIDNDLLDGTREVQFFATIFLPSCNCGLPAELGGVVTATLTILDNDGPSLSVQANPYVVPEGIADAGVLIIGRNTPEGEPTEVSIHNSMPNEIEIVESVTIPADQSFVEVPFNTIDDGIEDGNQFVTISVSAEGFNGASCWVMVTDRNIPDLVVSGVELAFDTIENEQLLPVEIEIANIGFRTAPASIDVNVYLSKNQVINEDSEIIAYLSTHSEIGAGETLAMNDELYISGFVGQYFIIVDVNASHQTNELIYINNQSDPVPITIAANYYAVASVDDVIFDGKTPITINGYARTLDHQPALHKDVEIYVIVDGTRRSIPATSDAAGNFTVNFQPVNGEAGHFTVGACFPGAGLTEAQDEFTIMGVKYIGDIIRWNIILGEPLQGSLKIKNFTGIPLNGVSIEIVSMPPGYELVFDPIGVLPGNAIVDVGYVITGLNPTDGLNPEPIQLRISSNEAADFNFSAWAHCKTLLGHVRAEPAYLQTSMITGQSNIREFEIQNIGLGETGTVSINLPEVEWMNLICPDTISSIPPGGSAVFTMNLTPTPDLPLNVPVTGNFVINCENANDISVPFSILTISTATGNLLVDVVNEYTYHTPSAPHVEGALVTLRHPYSGVVIASGLTNANGHFLIENLPEGYYTLSVWKEQHESYQNTIYVNPGQLNNQFVFLSFQAITFFWNVEPTFIDDEYEINLIVQYETNVPAPVVLIEGPDTIPQLSHGEQFPFILTLTNVGLLTAENARLIFPEDTVYRFIYLADHFDILPHQSIQVPVVVELKEGAQTGDNCTDAIVVFFDYICGPASLTKGGATSFVYEGRVCKGPKKAEGWPFYPGPVPHGNANIPIGFSIVDCDPCHMEMFDLINTAVGCICALLPPNAICTAHSFFNCVTGIVNDCLTNYNPRKCGKAVGGCVDLITDGIIPGWGLYSCLDDLLELCEEEEQGPDKAYQPGFLSEAKQKALIIQGVVNNMDLWFLEFTGDPVWFECDAFEFSSFYNYFESLDPEQGIEYNQPLIDQKPSNISNQQLETFVNRWNNTVLMIDGEDYDPANVIDMDLIQSYILAIDSYITETNILGFDSLADLFDNIGELLINGVNQNQNSVCATVTLQFSQNLTMTREAFEGTLTIYNGHETDAIENFTLNLEIRNEFNALSNDLFQINTISLDNLSEIDGTGVLHALQTGTAVVQFIPTKLAAPYIPRYYSFGGTLSYLDPFTNETVTKSLHPVSLKVNPSPDLYLDYFMQRNILGNDPLTPDIEPSIPAELAVMINNKGAGDALNVTLSSAQPVIIDNEKGLLIDFEIVGSNLSGQPVQLGLLDVDFGNIAAGDIAVGQWWFTSSLLGHFVSYEAHVTHLNSYGDPNLSLIGGVAIHELIKSIRAYGDLDDGINDFLVNDIPDANDYPDAIYFSDGNVADVYITLDAEIEGPIVPGDTITELTITPISPGWNYTRLDDPANGQFRIVSCTREDGQEIPLDNIWLTHVNIPDGGEPVYENKLHFVDVFDSMDTVNYTVVFERIEQNILRVVNINGIPDGVIDYSLASVEVVFNKAIDPETFSFVDIELTNQGGLNLADEEIIITQINDRTFEVDISSKTGMNGYYVLTVHTIGITDLSGNFGHLGKQVSWIQAFSVPAVLRFFGHPQGPGDAFDALYAYFNMPIDESTFTKEQLVFMKGEEILSTGDLELTQIDAAGRLFRISELLLLTLESDVYEITIKVTEIIGESGQYGLMDQSVQWIIRDDYELFVDAGPDDMICEGSVYSLEYASTNAPIYAWTGGDGYFDDEFYRAAYFPGEADIAAGQVELCIHASTTDGTPLLSDCMVLTINPLPEVVCPPAMFIQVDELPLQLSGATPPGGYFHGTDVEDNVFNPTGTNIFGFRHVHYTYTDDLGCTNHCSFTIRVDTLPVAYLNEIIIAAGEAFCHATASTIMTEDFVVEPGGFAQLVSMINIMMQPGTHIMQGAYLHAFIDSDSTFCEQRGSMLASEPKTSNAELFTPAVIDREASFIVYPNPSPGVFTIRWTDVEDLHKIRIEVYTLMGERLMAVDMPESPVYQLDLTKKQAGMYLLRIVYDNKSVVRRLIKQ